ncbi:hypothetical protein Cgig2_024982 [Carnegiea gigantea]|uniref:Uncharacterized protein n=1 Tax=Carnegiea gigantea TaxID=171969 RepID=A0A9Q1GMM4_9CARY|nr:hypothetical protein Cgig2_024982 [Carnegiea gigantea]
MEGCCFVLNALGSKECQCWAMESISEIPCVDKEYAKNLPKKCGTLDESCSFKTPYIYIRVRRPNPCGCQLEVAGWRCMRLLGSLALFYGWRLSVLLPVGGRRCCCRLEVVGAIARVIGSVLWWASLCSAATGWPADAMVNAFTLESGLILLSKLSIEEPVRIREEYFEGLLELPTVIKEECQSS